MIVEFACCAFAATEIKVEHLQARLSERLYEGTFGGGGNLLSQAHILDVAAVAIGESGRTKGCDLTGCRVGVQEQTCINFIGQ